MLKIVNNNFDKSMTKMLKKIFKKTLKLTDQKPRLFEVCLEFNNNKEMKELNNRTREIDKTTDVLSFPNLENVFNKKIKKAHFEEEVNPETGKIMLGDVVINVDRAKKQAEEYEHSFKREVCYLFVHGLLHLLGFDHIDELDKNLMRGQEELILSKFKITR